MSDWQRVIDNCKLAGLEAPEDMFDVSECIDKLDDQVRELKKENQKLKLQQASGAENKTGEALNLPDIIKSEAAVCDHAYEEVQYGSTGVVFKCRKCGCVY
jgi:hypothetical protein